MRLPGEDIRHTETLIKVGWRTVFIRIVTTAVGVAAVIGFIILMKAPV
jgi:hypothetical protein